MDTKNQNRTGDRIIIVLDCREGGVATGKYGKFLGWAPRFALVPAADRTTTQAIRLDALDDWLAAQQQQGLAVPAREEIEQENNIRLQLEDGSIIWGDECWWASEQEFNEKYGGNLDKMQQELTTYADAMQSLQRIIDEIKDKGAEKGL